MIILIILRVAAKFAAKYDDVGMTNYLGFIEFMMISLLLTTTFTLLVY